MSPFFYEAVSLIALLLIASYVTYIARKKHIPTTVMLVAVGIVIALLAKLPIFSFVDDFELTSEMLFYVFLPILLFESAYNINYKELLQNIRSISILAITSLIYSAFMIAGIFYLVSGLLGMQLPFLVTLLFGTLISATDTAAALSVFKDVGVPARLQMIYEGESLFNDGTAIALFMVVLSVAESHAIIPVEEHLNLVGNGITGLENMLGDWYPFISGAITMFLMIIVGILIGSIAGIIFSKVIQKIQNDTYLEITLSLILAHATFLVTEAVNHYFIAASSVIATVVAAMVLGNYGRTKISPKVEEMMDKYWGLFSFVSNSLIFILVGMLVINMHVDWKTLFWFIIVAFVIVLIARAVPVYTLISILNLRQEERYIPRAWQHVLAWGALRGGVAIMLLYLIPSNLMLVGWPDPVHSIRDFLTSITVGVVVLSVFINTFLIKPIIKRYHIDDLRDTEQVALLENQILILNALLEKLRYIIAEHYTDQAEGQRLRESYISELNAVKKELIALREKDPEAFGTTVRVATFRFALTTERYALANYYKKNQVPEKVYKKLFDRITTQIELLDLGEISIEKIRHTHQKDDFFEKISLYILDKLEPSITPIERQYYMARTMQYIVEKTFVELHKLEKITILSEYEEFHHVLGLYEHFAKESEMRRNELFREHRDELRNISGYLTEQILLAYKDELIERIEKRDIIPPKLIARI